MYSDVKKDVDQTMEEGERGEVTMSREGGGGDQGERGKKDGINIGFEKMNESACQHRGFQEKRRRKKGQTR